MPDDDPKPEDIIKILVTSDNHVGYNEKDEIRGGDSFRSFEEVLKIARDEKVRAPSRRPRRLAAPGAARRSRPASCASRAPVRRCALGHPSPRAWR